MKCPLIEMAGLVNYKQVTMIDMKCSKEECAWWDDKFQQCVNITSVEQLLRIANALNAMLEKMPPYGQFTK